MTDVSTGTVTGTLKLKADFFILNFAYLLFPLKMQVDGGEWQKVGWGEKDLQVPSGQHELAFKVLFYWFLPVAKATTTVTVPARGAVSLHYRAPLFAFPGVSGKATQV